MQVDVSTPRTGGREVAPPPAPGPDGFGTGHVTPLSRLAADHTCVSRAVHEAAHGRSADAKHSGGSANWVRTHRFGTFSVKNW